jgi:hypothetical protein
MLSTFLTLGSVIQSQNGIINSSALLETVKPANATKFSIEGGTIEMPVVVHKSITVSMKVD